MSRNLTQHVSQDFRDLSPAHLFHLTITTLTSSASSSSAYPPQPKLTEPQTCTLLEPQYPFLLSGMAFSFLYLPIFSLIVDKSYPFFKTQLRYHLLQEACSDSSRLSETTILHSSTSVLALTTDFVSIYLWSSIPAKLHPLKVGHASIPRYLILSPVFAVFSMFKRW